MGRPLHPSNLRQRERQQEREMNKLRRKVRWLENSVSQQRPYRACPNTEGVDPGVVGP